MLGQYGVKWFGRGEFPKPRTHGRSVFRHVATRETRIQRRPRTRHPRRRHRPPARRRRRRRRRRNSSAHAIARRPFAVPPPVLQHYETPAVHFGGSQTAGPRPFVLRHDDAKGDLLRTRRTPEHAVQLDT